MRYEARAYEGQTLYVNMVTDHLANAVLWCNRQMQNEAVTRVVVIKVPPVPIADTWKGVLHEPGDRSRATPVQVVGDWVV